MNGKIKLNIGVRPIEDTQLGNVITAIQNKISELQTQYPTKEITTDSYIWEEE